MMSGFQKKNPTNDKACERQGKRKDAVSGDKVAANGFAVTDGYCQQREGTLPIGRKKGKKNWKEMLGAKKSL